MLQYNFILVVGEQEEGSNSVSVRERDSTKYTSCSVQELKEKLAELVRTKK